METNAEEKPKLKRCRSKVKPKKKKKSYYKKKIGRKKKPGPKPKPKPKKGPQKRRGAISTPFKLILTVNNRQKEVINKFHTEEEAYRTMLEMYQKNQEEVVYPMKCAHYGGILRDVAYNLYLLKKVTDKDIDNVTQLRNEYGEFVNYDTNRSKWKVIDKRDWSIEETFWVFGYHPHYQRKDFTWIFTNLLEKTAHDKYMFKNVWLYKNKVIIECMEHLEIIFCKTTPEGVRLYNQLEEWCTERKFKYTVFCGRISQKTHVTQWTKRLCEWTGFNKTKVQRHNLRP